MSRKKSQTYRLLKGIKKASKATSALENVDVSGLREQYKVIREDIIKLRNDLQKGYDMAKGAVEKKSFLNQIFKR